MKKTLIAVVILFVFNAMVGGQSFQIMQYGIEDGLCHDATYSVIQDSDGFIWATTSQGLCRMDGKHFVSEFQGDTLPGTIASITFRDSRDRVWFGYMDGQIAMLEDGIFNVLPQEDAKISTIVGFAESMNGQILAMTQRSGLITIEKDLSLDYITEPFEGLFASSFLLTPEGSLIVGGFNGATLFTTSDGPGNYRNAGAIEGLPFTRIQTIRPAMQAGAYWVGTEDEGLYRINGHGSSAEDFSVVRAGADMGLEYSSINSILVDKNGYLWVSDYGVGVVRFRVNEISELSGKTVFDVAGGLPEAYIKGLLKDDEGNIWFASQGNGLAVLRDQAFTFYHVAGGEKVPAITAIYIDGDEYWLGSREGKLYRTLGSSQGDYEEFNTSNGLPGTPVSALWKTYEGDLYIGTNGNGVYKLDKGASHCYRSFTADNDLGNTVNALTGDEDTIWIATNDGIYSINLLTGQMGHQTTLTGLPHNVINDVLIDQNGRTWIATRGSGIYCVDDEEGDLKYTIQGNPKLEFVSLAEDENGQIWAGTAEDGVFKFDEDTLAVYSLEAGLKEKYTYAVEIDPDGYVWVGHRLGLSRIDPDGGNITIYDQQMGFTSDVMYRAVDVGDAGLVLFGTNEGVIVYDTYQSKTDTVPPRLNITELNISDSIYSTNSPIMLPYGVYKVRFEYIGINLSNPDQVTYRYKLDGFDDWSEPTRETFAKYSRIEDGDYTFMLSACDGNGNCTGEIAMINISVKIPIWKTWWFIVSLVIIAIVSVFLIIKIRERNQKALQEYLEQQLDERTREVIHQKEEIEIKNRDITDSINYAQRIQASILPSVQRLHDTFDGSFVFYQPRDIVSGDFYWYDKLDDDRFMIVCADSTGHGVPGAFMSMIGTTLIKDICLRENVTTPSEVLKTLDEEVREALHQNKETDGSNDGMDIIVAEINLKTNKFVVSSAMRPVILYKGGEQLYVKGSRSSIGGQLDDTVIEKEFSNEEFQLSKGDIIYMFSDGYPDQFGGPLGRKFKMVRLKNLLRDIHDKPMEEQHNYVKSNFFLWKEDLEQVDDVLFMGIKI